MSKLNDFDRDYSETRIKPGINYFGFLHKLKLDDKRLVNCLEEFQKTGSDYTETWNLQITLAGIIASKLGLFLQYTRATPLGETEESWDNKLKSIKSAFNEIGKDFPNEPLDFENKEERLGYFNNIQKQLDTFSKVFLSLWW